MTDLRNLMESTRMYAGFNGAECIDRLPQLSLLEATSQLPCIIVESQIDLLSMRRPTRGNLSEAAAMTLNEGALTNLKEKVDAFFERMLKWIQSIIAKLKVQIDRIKLTGEDLYKKYADKLGTDSDYAGITFKGYRFAEGSKTIYSLQDNFDTNVENLVQRGLQRAGVSGKVLLPHDFGIMMKGLARKIPEGQSLAKEKYDEISESIDQITDLSREERSAAMASLLAGRDLGEDWESELHRRCWGEKGPIRYGTDMFHPRVIGQVLKDRSLFECMDGYEKLRSTIRDYRTRLRGELSDLWDEFYTNTDAAILPGNLSTQALINRYYSVYISCVGDALHAATQLKNLKVAFYTEMHRQAIAMLVRLVNKGDGGGE